MTFLSILNKEIESNKFCILFPHFFFFFVRESLLGHLKYTRDTMLF